MMITVNSRADIFFLGKRKICIFLEGKTIEIEDTDNGIMTSFLQWLYVKFFGSLDFFVDELGLGSSADKLEDAVNYLVKIGVLFELKTFPASSDVSITPFIPFNFYKNVWGIRRGQKLFFFIASNQSDAISKAKEMALSWVDEVEAGVVSGLLERKIDCLSAKISFPETELATIDKNRILIYDSVNNDFAIHERKFSKKEKNFDFWQELIKRSTEDLGIVPIVKEIPCQEGLFSLNLHTFISCHKLSSLRDESDDWQIGRDKSLKIAKGKSIMEAIERYCGRKRLNEKMLVYSSMKELGLNNCLDPLKIVSYSKLQFEKNWLRGIIPFEPNLKLNWVKLKNFRKNDFKLVPECFITYPERAFHFCESSQLFFANSNGMAGHINLDEAVERGVLEIIERDAILIYWINRISPNKIIFPDKCPGFIKSIKRKFESVGYQLAILDLTLDTVPVIMSIAYKEDGDFGFFCGAAAAKSKLAAIRKSIEELEFTVWARLKNSTDLRKEVESMGIESIWKPSHHEAIYLKPKANRHLEFLYKGEKISFNERELRAETEVFTAVENIGKEIYHIDLTAEDVQDLSLGIKIIRCIIPEFVPITFGYGYEPLAMKRIYDIPSSAGMADKFLCESDVVENYLPHFFP